MKIMNSEKNAYQQYDFLVYFCCQYILLPSCPKINSKRLKDLNGRHDTIKPQREITGKTFSDIDCTHVFLGQLLNVKEIEAKINKWELLNVQVFAQQRKSLKKKKKPKRQLMEWKKNQKMM